MSDEPRDDILDATGTALRVPLVRIQFHFATAGAGFQGDHGRKVELPRDAANLGLNDFVDPQTGRFSTTRPPVVDELQGGEDVVVGRSRIVPNPDLFGKENTVSLIRPHDFAATSSKPTKPLEERKAHITQRMERLAQWKRMHGEDKLLELKHPDVLLYFVCKHAGKLPHGKALEVAEKHMESTNTLVQRLHSAAGESKGLAQEGMALFNTHFSETGFWMLNEDIRDFAVERFKEIVEKGAKRKANDVEGADGGLGTKRAKASDETNP